MTGTATQSPAMGGPARDYAGGTGKLKGAADNNLRGVGINWSKFVAWIPHTTTGFQLIYACIRDNGDLGWWIRQNGSGVDIGNAGNIVVPITATCVIGTPIGVGIQYDSGTSKIRAYVNGVFANEYAQIAQVPGGTFNAFVGSYDGSMTSNSIIAAPTGWRKALGDALQAAIWNAGSPWRLT
jgi:hypothetical protein